MKRLLTLTLLVLILTAPAIAKDLPVSIQADLDMYLGYKMGVRYDMNDKLSLISGFGVNALLNSQYCYSFYASYRTMEIYDRWHIGVNFGILQGVFDNTSAIEDQYVYINPGVTMTVSYPVIDQLRIGAQGGMVMMIGYDRQMWGTSLEPFVGITLIYSDK